jgi:hypothetical protein
MGFKVGDTVIVDRDRCHMNGIPSTNKLWRYPAPMKVLRVGDDWLDVGTEPIDRLWQQVYFKLYTKQSTLKFIKDHDPRKGDNSHGDNN